jgi:hypothetical protein
MLDVGYYVVVQQHKNTAILVASRVICATKFVAH